MLGAFDYRDGWGNCPPGMYRPDPFNDCRPNVSGQYIQQHELSKSAAVYTDESSTQGNSTQSTGAPSQSFYTAQPPQSIQAPVVSGSGGSDNTMLLLLGAVALVLVMKK